MFVFFTKNQKKNDKTVEKTHYITLRYITLHYITNVYPGSEGGARLDTGGDLAQQTDTLLGQGHQGEQQQQQQQQQRSVDAAAKTQSKQCNRFE